MIDTLVPVKKPWSTLIEYNYTKAQLNKVNCEPCVYFFQIFTIYTLSLTGKWAVLLCNSWFYRPVLNLHVSISQLINTARDFSDIGIDIMFVIRLLFNFPNSVFPQLSSLFISVHVYLYHFISLSPLNLSSPLYLFFIFMEILIKIQNVSFKKMCLKMPSAKWRPFCPGGGAWGILHGTSLVLT